jgi:hypothetical protein
MASATASPIDGETWLSTSIVNAGRRRLERIGHDLRMHAGDEELRRETMAEIEAATA